MNQPFTEEDIQITKICSSSLVIKEIELKPWLDTTTCLLEEMILEILTVTNVDENSSNWNTLTCWCQCEVIKAL